MTRVNPWNKFNGEYGLEYCEDFRDPKLKINDDRKIKINLTQIHEEKVSLFLMIWTHDLRKAPAKEGEFDRAQYRLMDEGTNQTLDYQ